MINYYFKFDLVLLSSSSSEVPGFLVCTLWLSTVLLGTRNWEQDACSVSIPAEQALLTAGRENTTHKETRNLAQPNFIVTVLDQGF